MVSVLSCESSREAPSRRDFVTKAVILAGGQGSRMGCVYDRPKPLLEIGGRPVISHVIDVYLDAGTTDFVLCCGHRFEEFVAWLDSTANYRAPQVSGLERCYVLDRAGVRCTLTLVDTGENTASGGRLRRVGEHLDAPFFLTYADGLADVDLAAAASFHAATGAAVTVTAFPLGLQCGVMEVDPGEHFARTFKEKPVLSDHWCNGGYYTVAPDVVATTCTGDAVSWESDVLPLLAEEGRLAVFRHAGFWASMDFPYQYESLLETYRAQGAVWRGKAVEDAG
jgi:glucose-1-phosphate cytidylyltransferase